MKLSPSALGTFKDCPACFYLERKMKIKKPRGIFSSLPMGMDSKIKTYADGLRVAGDGPSIFTDHPDLAGYELFFDLDKLKKWRNWRSGLSVKGSGWSLSGALDDALYNRKTDEYIPLDYKTKGTKADLDYCKKYYQNQLDAYSLMLHGNGMKTAGFGVLVYFSPEAIEGEFVSSANFRFDAEIFVLEVDHNRIKALCDAATECLKSMDCPDHSSQCDLERYWLERKDWEENHV